MQSRMRSVPIPNRAPTAPVGVLFGVPALAGPDRLKAGHRTDGTTRTGSWSQCMRKNERGLSMNRTAIESQPALGKRR